MRNSEQEKFLKLCREVGWKCTSQRLAVYEFLAGNLTHPDVDTVWNAVRATQPAITRESVYRILNEFSAKGIIRRLDQIDIARYDSRTGAHGHFICEKCGEISDFDWPGGTTLALEQMPGDVTHMEIRLAGVCRKCANRHKDKSPQNQ